MAHVWADFYSWHQQYGSCPCNLCLLEEIEAIYTALTGQDLLPLHPALVKPMCLLMEGTFEKCWCVFTGTLLNSDGLHDGERECLALAPWGLNRENTTSSTVRIFSAILWPCDLQHVMSHAVESMLTLMQIVFSCMPQWCPRYLTFPLCVLLYQRNSGS